MFLCVLCVLNRACIVCSCVRRLVSHFLASLIAFFWDLCSHDANGIGFGMLIKICLHAYSVALWRDASAVKMFLCVLCVLNRAYILCSSVCRLASPFFASLIAFSWDLCSHDANSIGSFIDSKLQTSHFIPSYLQTLPFRWVTVSYMWLEA